MTELYKNDTVPGELLAWAQTLRADWEKSEAAKKAKAAAAVAAGTPAPMKAKTDKVQGGLARAAVRAATEGLPVYSVSADVQGSTGIQFISKELSERFIEVGIAESNMISGAPGSRSRVSFRSWTRLASSA